MVWKAVKTVTISKFYFEFFSGNKQNAQYSSQLRHICFIFQYINISIFTNLSVKRRKVEDKPEEMQWRKPLTIITKRSILDVAAALDPSLRCLTEPFLHPKYSNAECESNKTTFFCLFLTVCFLRFCLF